MSFKLCYTVLGTQKVRSTADWKQAFLSIISLTKVDHLTHGVDSSFHILFHFCVGYPKQHCHSHRSLRIPSYYSHLTAMLFHFLKFVTSIFCVVIYLKQNIMLHLEHYKHSNARSTHLWKKITHHTDNANLLLDSILLASALLYRSKSFNPRMMKFS